MTDLSDTVKLKGRILDDSLVKVTSTAEVVEVTPPVKKVHDAEVPLVVTNLPELLVCAGKAELNAVAETKAVVASLVDESPAVAVVPVGAPKFGVACKAVKPAAIAANSARITEETPDVWSSGLPLTLKKSFAITLKPSKVYIQ
jgi:hypothetical protein